MPQDVSQKPLLPMILGAVLLGLIVGGVVLYLSTKSVDMTLGINADKLAQMCKLSDVQNTFLTEAAQGEMRNMAPAQDSPSLRDMAFKDGSDGAVTIADMRGKVLLVNLWATWCEPCREEMPYLDDLQGTLGGDAFEVVAISVDTTKPEKPRKFLDDIGIKHLRFYRDETMGVFNRLRRDGHAVGLPVTLLVGRDGCVISSMNGPAIWSSLDAQQYIQAILQSLLF